MTRVTPSLEKGQDFDILIDRPQAYNPQDNPCQDICFPLVAYLQDGTENRHH